MISTSIINAQQINNDFVEGEIYVKLKPELIGRSLNRISENLNVQRDIPAVNRVVRNVNSNITKAKAPFFQSKNVGLRSILRLKIDSNDSIDQIIKDLKEDPTVEYAERIPIRRIISVPSDTLYSSQWHLAKIKASEAWDVNAGVQNIVVAVVDNAIQVNHIDLAANMIAGRDVSDNDNDPSPPNSSFSHGTHVSGIVAAVNNNITGIASAGNNRVKVMPVKATHDASYNGYIDNGYEGISWAVLNGAKIISLSWGGGGYSQTEQDVINDAYQNGVIVIAAAGNENSSVLQYPAAYEHVIAVASLDNNDSRSSFSSYGEYVDISAPGRGIQSTIPFNNYASFSGTSMATPLVSSCAAYLLACFPEMPIDSVEIVLKATSDNIDIVNPNFVGFLGSGRVNLLKAISCKNVDLFVHQPFVLPSNYFCAGDSALLDIAAVSTESFDWLVNNVSVSSSKQFYVKNEGKYRLKRTLGTCTLVAEPINIIHNKVFTSKPSVTDLSVYYCDADANFVVATHGNCDVFGPLSYAYLGPVVGFDGFEKSGNYPTINVSGIGGLIDSVSVSLTWQKKDGGTENDCGLADFGATPFNEEVSFQLVSPEGQIIDLVRAGAYARGSTSSGLVTTVFIPNGIPISGKPLPSSGVFGAAGDLNVLENKIPQGIWTLIANDDAALDPLCISGFSITIKTKEPSSPAGVKWYSDASLKTLVSINDTLSVNTNILGTQTYFAVTSCEGLCPGTSEKSEVIIKSVPDLFAFSESSVLLSNDQIQEVSAAQTLDFSISPDNKYTVFGINSSGNPYSYLLSNQAPNTSPVSLCSDTNFVVFGLGCSGTISWSNGSTGLGVSFTNLTTAMSVTATCNQSWSCTPLSNVPFSFVENMSSLTISGSLIESSNQNYFGKTIESTQVLNVNTRVGFSAAQSILLNPGFESKTSSVFKAEIGNCPN